MQALHHTICSSKLLGCFECSNYNEGERHQKKIDKRYVDLACKCTHRCKGQANKKLSHILWFETWAAPKAKFTHLDNAELRGWCILATGTALLRNTAKNYSGPFKGNSMIKQPVVG